MVYNSCWHRKIASVWYPCTCWHSLLPSMFNLTLSPPAILNKKCPGHWHYGKWQFCRKNGIEGFEMKLEQGAKKIIFIACHSGKQKLAPKPFWLAELISQFFLFDSLRKDHLPSGKLKTAFTSPIAKSSSPGLSTLLSWHDTCMYCKPCM